MGPGSDSVLPQKISSVLYMTAASKVQSNLSTCSCLVFHENLFITRVLTLFVNWLKSCRSVRSLELLHIWTKRRTGVEQQCQHIQRQGIQWGGTMETLLSVRCLLGFRKPGSVALVFYSWGRKYEKQTKILHRGKRGRERKVWRLNNCNTKSVRWKD